MHSNGVKGAQFSGSKQSTGDGTQIGHLIIQSHPQWASTRNR